MCVEIFDWKFLHVTEQIISHVHHHSLCHIDHNSVVSIRCHDSDSIKAGNFSDCMCKWCKVQCITGQQERCNIFINQISCEHRSLNICNNSYKNKDEYYNAMKFIISENIIHQTFQ